MRPYPGSLRDVADRAAAGQEDFFVLLDEFLDAFYSEPGRRAAMLAEEPHRVDERKDAYLGAVAEHLARRWELPIPPWAEDGSRSVAHPWFVGELGIALSGLYLVESPLAFRRRRIFTEAEPLRRARMPLTA